MTLANKARPTAIYRLYGSSGTLLYIGRSVNPSFRWEHHAEHDCWWAEVAHKTLEWFDKPNVAKIAHRKAIATESPVHNQRVVSGADRDWCVNTHFGSATAKSVVLYAMTTVRRCLPLDFNAITERLELTEHEVRAAVQHLVAHDCARIEREPWSHPGDVLQLLTPTRLAVEALCREDRVELAARAALRVKQPARPRIPVKLREAVYERDGYACLKCGATSPLSLDHIHPWSKGGPDTMENLQTLCGPCNSSKQDRIEDAA